MTVASTDSKAFAVKMATACLAELPDVSVEEGVFKTTEGGSGDTRMFTINARLDKGKQFHVSGYVMRDGSTEPWSKGACSVFDGGGLLRSFQFAFRGDATTVRDMRTLKDDAPNPSPASAGS